MIIVHASAMITEHVTCPERLMLGVLEGEGSGGLRRAADLPMTDSILEL